MTQDTDDILALVFAAPIHLPETNVGKMMVMSSHSESQSASHVVESVTHSSSSQFVSSSSSHQVSSTQFTSSHSSSHQEMHSEFHSSSHAESRTVSSESHSMTLSGGVQRMAISSSDNVIVEEVEVVPAIARRRGTVDSVASDASGVTVKSDVSKASDSSAVSKVSHKSTKSNASSVSSISAKSSVSQRSVHIPDDVASVVSETSTVKGSKKASAAPSEVSKRSHHSRAPSVDLTAVSKTSKTSHASSHHSRAPSHAASAASKASKGSTNVSQAVAQETFVINGSLHGSRPASVASSKSSVSAKSSASSKSSTTSLSSASSKGSKSTCSSRSSTCSSTTVSSVSSCSTLKAERIASKAASKATSVVSQVSHAPSHKTASVVSHASKHSHQCCDSHMEAEHAALNEEVAKVAEKCEKLVEKFADHEVSQEAEVHSSTITTTEHAVEAAHYNYDKHSEKTATDVDELIDNAFDQAHDGISSHPSELSLLSEPILSPRIPHSSQLPRAHGLVHNTDVYPAPVYSDDFDYDSDDSGCVKPLRTVFYHFDSAHIKAVKDWESPIESQVVDAHGKTADEFKQELNAVIAKTAEKHEEVHSTSEHVVHATKTVTESHHEHHEHDGHHVEHHEHQSEHHDHHYDTVPADAAHLYDVVPAEVEIYEQLEPQHHYDVVAVEQEEAHHQHENVAHEQHDHHEQVHELSYHESEHQNIPLESVQHVESVEHCQCGDNESVCETEIEEHDIKLPGTEQFEDYDHEEKHSHDVVHSTGAAEHHTTMHVTTTHVENVNGRVEARADSHHLEQHNDQPAHVTHEQVRIIPKGGPRIRETLKPVSRDVVRKGENGSTIITIHGTTVHSDKTRETQEVSTTFTETTTTHQHHHHEGHHEEHHHHHHHDEHHHVAAHEEHHSHHHHHHDKPLHQEIEHVLEQIKTSIDENANESLVSSTTVEAAHREHEEESMPSRPVSVMLHKFGGGEIRPKPYGYGEFRSSPHMVGSITNRSPIRINTSFDAPRTPIASPVIAAAAKSPSSESFQSVRVVKSVREFVKQWGQPDFVPPTSPVITAPRFSPRAHTQSAYATDVVAKNQSHQSAHQTQVHDIVVAKNQSHQSEHQVHEVSSTEKSFVVQSSEMSSPTVVTTTTTFHHSPTYCCDAARQAAAARKVSRPGELRAVSADMH